MKNVSKFRHLAKSSKKRRIRRKNEKRLNSCYDCGFERVDVGIPGVSYFVSYCNLKG